MPSHPVNREGGRGGRREDIRRMVVAMPKAVPEPICVPRLQCPERPVPDGPSAAGGPHDGCHCFPALREIGGPRELSRFSFRVDLPICQHVGLQAKIRVAGRQSVIPPKALRRAGLPVAPLPCPLRLAGPEPTEQQFMVPRPLAGDETDIPLFRVVGVRAAGSRPIPGDGRLHVRTPPAEVIRKPLCRVPFTIVPRRSVPPFGPAPAPTGKPPSGRGWTVAAPKAWWQCVLDRSR